MLLASYTTPTDVQEMWQALKDATYDESTRVLSLPEGTEFAIVVVSSEVRRMYVREVYDAIFDYIQEGVGLAAASKSVRAYARIITGTPGMGKSMFLLYILWKLRNDSAFSGKIIYSHKEDDNMDTDVYVFDGDDVRLYTSFDGEPREATKQEGNWWLMDGQFHGPWSGAATRATTIMPFSPRKAFKSQHPVHKVHRAEWAFWMPLWDYGEVDENNVPLEIKMCRDALFPDPKDPSYISDEQLQERIARIGCVPRYLFDEDEQFDNIITTALEETDRSVQQLVVSVIDNTAMKESHRLLFRDANSAAPFEKRALRWASPYVITRVREKLRLNLGEAATQYLALRDKASMRSAAGVLFQVLATPILQRGGIFDWRPLVAATEQTLPWETLSLPEFEDHRTYESPEQLANLTVDDSPVFFETKRGQPTFDAILVFPDCDILQFFFVQFSLSIEHDLKGKAFVEALAAVPSNSKVHYLRVSDPFVDRLQTGERHITTVSNVANKEPLYYWYSEIIEVLNDNKNAQSRGTDRQRKVSEANGDERFSTEKRAPLENFISTVRDFTFTQEEMRIEIPDRLPSP